MKSIPNNKLPHHLRTRSGGAKEETFDKHRKIRRNYSQGKEAAPVARSHRSRGEVPNKAKGTTEGLSVFFYQPYLHSFLLISNTRSFCPPFLRVLTQILSYSLVRLYIPFYKYAYISKPPPLDQEQDFSRTYLQNPNHRTYIPAHKTCNRKTSGSRGRTIITSTFNYLLREGCEPISNRCSDRKYEKRQSSTSKQIISLPRRFS